MATFWHCFLALAPQKQSGEGKESGAEAEGLEGVEGLGVLSNIALSTGYNLRMCVFVSVSAIACRLFDAGSITPPSGSAAMLQSSSGTDSQLTIGLRSPSHVAFLCSNVCCDKSCC